MLFDGIVLHSMYSKVKRSFSAEDAVECEQVIVS